MLAGSVVTGRLVRRAVQRHRDDLENAHTRGWKFDAEKALDACEFFPNILRHSTGEFAHERFSLTPCQLFVTWVLFGWRSADTGLRRFKRAYVSWARKNGKTTWAAGVAIYCLTADDPIEQAAQVYCVATKEDQAAIMLREAQSMCKQSPSLERTTLITKKNIAYPRTMSFFRPLGSDSKTNAGWNPHAVLLDEVCDWQDHHRGLWDALTTAAGVRRQPLQLTICTAGNDESRLWQEEDDFAVKVLEQSCAGNVVDDNYFAFVARIDDEHMCDDCHGTGCGSCVNGVVAADDPFDENVWVKANPNLDLTVKREYLREQANVARHKPASRNAFVRYHCNKRVASDAKAIDTDLWNLCGGELSDWSNALVCGAFDLGRKSDLASMALVAKIPTGTDEDGTDRYRYEVRQWSFTHEEVDLPLSQEPWSAFIRRGELLVNSGNVIDLPGAFKDHLLDVASEYSVQQWAFDPNNAIYLATELINTHGVDCVEFTQTYFTYNEPISELLQLIKAKTWRHGNDQLLTHAASNLVIHANQKDEWMPAKARSGGKIDPIVAAIMAFALAMKIESYWSPSQGVTL